MLVSAAPARAALSDLPDPDGGPEPEPVRVPVRVRRRTDGDHEADLQSGVCTEGGKSLIIVIFSIVTADVLAGPQHPGVF